jgi:type IV pilus assembly protein PilV
MKQSRNSQSGFTLVEAIVATLILAVGIVAVTNLMVWAASSNEIGNLTTVAAAEASETLERLKAVDYYTLMPPANPVAQGSLTADAGAANATPTITPDIFVGGVLTYHMYRQVPGVGIVRTRWTVTPAAGGGNTTLGSPILTFITVQSQVMVRLGGQLSQSTFSTWRACTNAGC